MKRFAAFLTAFMAVISLAACSDTAEDLSAENDVSAQDTESVTAAESEQAETVAEFAEAIWEFRSEEDMYEKSEVIANVTVNSLEEIAVSYTAMGTECTSYHTLATVSVNKVYYPAEEEISGEFVLSLPVSSHTPYEDFPEIKTGESCIVFISSTAGLDDVGSSVEIRKRADYWLGHPADVININGTECVADDIFSGYSDSSVPVMRSADSDLTTGRCSMPLSDFEETLAEKIYEKFTEN